MQDAAKRGALRFFMAPATTFPSNPANRTFDDPADYCPPGAELALYLAEKDDYPDLEPHNSSRAG